MGGAERRMEHREATGGWGGGPPAPSPTHTQDLPEDRSVGAALAQVQGPVAGEQAPAGDDAAAPASAAATCRCATFPISRSLLHSCCRPFRRPSSSLQRPSLAHSQILAFCNPSSLRRPSQACCPSSSCYSFLHCRSSRACSPSSRLQDHELVREGLRLGPVCLLGSQQGLPVQLPSPWGQEGCVGD